MISIYALVDPRTNEAKYVGQTSQKLRCRLNNHMSCRPRAGSNIYEWNKKLKDAGIKPIIIELERVPKSGWIEAEQFWIAYLRFLGAILVNDAIGGPGATGHIQSEEEKEKKRIGNLGKKRSDETRQNMSIAKQKLMREKPEIREMYADMVRKLTRTPESYKKVAEKMKGRSLSEDHKQQIRDSKQKKSGLTSKYKGVYFDKDRNKWVSSIRFNMKKIQRRYSTELEAARAYDKKAFELLGEHAQLNFPVDYGMFSHAA